MPDGLEGRYIRLKVFGVKSLQVPSEPIPAGIYVSINVDSTRVRSSDESVAWGNPLTSSPWRFSSLDASLALSQWASKHPSSLIECWAMELIGKLDTLWDDLLDHGDEPFGRVLLLIMHIY
ncbi:hypothetical protein DEU56DRAFT_981360 [Suillus clintonianus]|uniref:uncharacterized protein n=1 Tax=Suillus clintonianus TaxID=1904413 RepID=UPI001B865C86|nr:uncharacterized protein DEU56DRAFT_981360 [Suillus clintonianus]KAG2134473.1 hypothetical protein DEU56DRAFT_981360 [Suillus clintonianus]